jgi:hypothetical protein
MRRESSEPRFERIERLCGLGYRYVVSVDEQDHPQVAGMGRIGSERLSERVAAARPFAQRDLARSSPLTAGHAAVAPAPAALGGPKSRQLR